MKKAILTVGISASGKTKWAEDFVRRNDNWTNINRDDIRFSIVCPDAKTWSDYKFSGSNEKRVTQVQDSLIEHAAELRTNIVISDTNLAPSIRKRLYDKLEGLGYGVEEKAFPVTLEEAYKRDAGRARGVGQQIIYEQWLKWLEYSGRKRYVADTSKPKAIMFDIDGTLAQMCGRSPFDWHRVGEDAPVDSIVRLVKCHEHDHQIIFLSGRDGVCRFETVTWLKEHVTGGEQPLLFMRRQGDMRKDTIVKEEIFWDSVAKNYNVVGVVDDRPSVVRMWYDVGIPMVICVANPWREF